MRKEFPEYASRKQRDVKIIHLYGRELKWMLLLIGTKEDFTLHQDWVLDNTGLEKAQYIKARKSLVEKGWLKYEPRKELTVDFNAILGRTDPHDEEDKGSRHDEGDGMTSMKVSDSHPERCQNDTYANKKRS